MAEPRNKGRKKTRQTKDRVLQARIPQHLDEELREQAEQLGLSVSTVVRNVLLNTFELVEGVVADSTNLARVIQGRKPRSRSRGITAPAAAGDETTPPIIGWQEVVLNLNGTCDHCNQILRKGERAALGIPAQARPALLCLPCLRALSKDEGEKP